MAMEASEIERLIKESIPDAEVKIEDLTLYLDCYTGKD